MKYIIILVINLFCLQFSYSQIHEIGVIFGGSNFIGDMGSTYFINPNEIAIGGIYKWNRSPRHSWRISGLKTDISPSDLDSDDPRRKARGYYFTNKTILEASAGIEYNFVDFDLHKTNRAHTPYIYTGLIATAYHSMYIDPSTGSPVTNANDRQVTLGIPMTLGYKFRFTHAFIIAAEIGARYTFTDGLDGSLPDDPTYDQFKFGNTNNNDWYMFTGITLTYTFGRNPCYCIN